MNPAHFCSFCGKHNNYVKAMIQGPDTESGRSYICNECVDLAKEVIEKHLKKMENDNHR